MMGRFELKTVAFIIFLWATLNLVNGVLIFERELLNTQLGSEMYYMINGTVRILIGLVSLALFYYIWKYADTIAIFERNGDD